MRNSVSLKIAETELSLFLGDITKHQADAIVNAANSGLMGGGGVDGAIHRAGGPSILAECKKYRETEGKLPAGQAMITTGGNLPAKFVIHTVGPIWHGGDRGESETLASCYTASLALAVSNKVSSVAFPSVSTGVYGYPLDLAAAVALDAVQQFLETHAGLLERVSWVLFDEATFSSYRRVLERESG